MQYYVDEQGNYMDETGNYVDPSGFGADTTEGGTGDGFTSHQEPTPDPAANGTGAGAGKLAPEAAQEAAADDGMNYYQNGDYQGYYYQDADGNYFYYDPAAAEGGGFENTIADDTNGAFQTPPNVPPTTHNIVRSYEMDAWEPRSFGWFQDIIIETFFSKPYKVYLTILLYCATCFIACLGLQYSFNTLYRLFFPPTDLMPDLQAFGYLAIFFYLSFIITSALCAVMDMTRNVWTQTREDTQFWGMSHRFLSKTKPPYVVFLILIIVTTFLPILWGLVEAGIKKQSLLYVAQCYANVAVLVATVLVAICYIWFYWRSLVFKRSAINNFRQRDDFKLRKFSYKNHPTKMNKTHWYHAGLVLEEFGFDHITLQTNVIVFVIGLVPLFALLAAQRLSTYTPTPSVAWGAISSIAFIAMCIIAWLTLLHRKNQWAIYVSVVLIIVLAALGCAGSGVGGKPVVVGVVAVLFIVSQGMVTRKRKHRLTRIQKRTVMAVPETEPLPVDELKKPLRLDSYLCCCRNTLLTYLPCVDVKTRFGFRHPKVAEAERRLMIQRVALRTDQKVLLVWWFIVMLAVAFVIALGNGMRYTFTDPIAARSDTATVGTDPTNLMCRLRYNTNSTRSPLTAVDLSFLAALSYTFGTAGDTDFATWFGDKPSLMRRYPVHLPPTLKFATDGIAIQFSDFVDVETDFHVVTLNGNFHGMQVFRDVDDWGESMTLQVAGAIAPLINLWSEQSRAKYVQTGSFFRTFFPPSTALDNVRAYLTELLQTTPLERILLVGDQFNGGYAKQLSSELGVDFVAFNAPGTKYKLPLLSRGTQFTSVRSIWSYIDSVADTAQTFYLPCEDSMSSNKCSRITTTIDYLQALCGDTQGRSFL